VIRDQDPAAVCFLLVVAALLFFHCHSSPSEPAAQAVHAPALLYSQLFARPRCHDSVSITSARPRQEGPGSFTLTWQPSLRAALPRLVAALFACRRQLVRTSIIRLRAVPVSHPECPWRGRAIVSHGVRLSQIARPLDTASPIVRPRAETVVARCHHASCPSRTTPPC
jgi:hypothetical protein